ncbi:MAG: ABC transporter permease [Clostridia bacterium]|nr:ABC transporter permease [Clostridia bacterium]
MRSLSPLKFLSRNKSRALILVIMLAFTMVPLIAGMYSDCIYSDFAINNKRGTPYIRITSSGNSAEARDAFSEFCTHIDDYKIDGATTILYGFDVGCNYECILGQECGNSYFMCSSTEDYHKLRAILPEIPDDLELADHEIAVSKYLANALNVKEGDMFSDPDDMTSFTEDVKIKKVLDCEGYQCFGVIEDNYRGVAMILRDTPAKPIKVGLFGVSTDTDEVSEALEDTVKKLNNEYPKLLVMSNETDQEDMIEQVGMLRYVLVLVTILVTVVLIITVNAVFTAVYDRRRFEFSLYKGIGIRSSEIFSKIFGEVLIMDGVGIVLGIVITSGVVYVLNQMLLESGKRFWFVPSIAVVMAIICNVAVIIPVVFMNWRRVRKYDVTEF